MVKWNNNIKLQKKELSEMEAGNLPDGEFNYYGCKDFQITGGRLDEQSEKLKTFNKEKI